MSIDVPRKPNKFKKSFKDKLDVKHKQRQTQIDNLGAPILITDGFVDNPIKIMGIGFCILIVLNVISFSLGFYKIQEASRIREFALGFN